jgi:GAF domain-containing protein
MEITTFQALADQLAIALDNARLISESRQAVEETQRAYGQISRQAWTDFLSSLNDHNLTYRYGLGESKSSPHPQPLPVAPLQTELLQARQSVMQTGQPVQLRLAGRATLLLPIRVRDQIIGVVKLIKEPSAEVDVLRSNGHDRDVPQPGAQLAAWKTEEVELLEAIIEQLGAAMDSARLFAETRQRAEQERLVDQVTSQMRATLDIDTVLETAVRELRDALGLAEVEVRLGNGATDDDR